MASLSQQHEHNLLSGVPEDEKTADAPSSISDTFDNSCSDNLEKAEAAKLGNTGDGKTGRSKSQIAITMAALALACFLAALDQTIVTNALPTIAADFHISSGNYTWVGASYLLASAAASPTWGKTSDIFGRKPIVLLANLTFLVGSLICALSIDIQMLLAGRVIQGVGGGGLLTMVYVCISDMFSLRERGLYFSLISLVWALASALGPIIGGAFTEYVSWRWIFWLNLPCGGVSFVFIFCFLEVHNPKTGLVPGLHAVDWVGTLTIVGGTVMFLIGLVYGGVAFPWSSVVVVNLIVFGLLTFGIFLLCEWKLAKYPVMPPRLFANLSNAATIAAAFIQGFVCVADAFLLPLYFQVILDATPLLSGVYALPYIIAVTFSSAGTGLFMSKTGKFTPVIWAAMALLTLGHGLYIDFPSTPSWARVILFPIISGAGVGPMFQAPLVALQAHNDPGDMAAATATSGFTRDIANSLGVVIVGVVFQNRVAAHASELANVLSPDQLAQLGGGTASSTLNIIHALPDEQKAVVRDVYTKSIATVWIFFTAVSAVGLAVSFLVSGKNLSEDHEERETGLQAEEKGRQARLLREKSAKEAKDATSVDAKPSAVLL